MQATATDEQGLPLPELLLRVPAWLMLELLRNARRRAELSPEGPQLPTIAVLACLVEFGPQSQRDVAARLRFDPSDVVGIVDRLEAAGHAVRGRDDNDRRRYALAATPAGAAWLRARLALIDERAASFLPGLDEDELAELQRLLRRSLAHADPRVPPRHRDA